MVLATVSYVVVLWPSSDKDSGASAQGEVLPSRGDGQGGQFWKTQTRRPTSVTIPAVPPVLGVMCTEFAARSRQVLGAN